MQAVSLALACKIIKCAKGHRETDRSQFPFSCGIYGAIVVKVAVKYNFMDLDRSVLNLWTMGCDGERIGSGNVQGN